MQSMHPTETDAGERSASFLTADVPNDDDLLFFFSFPPPAVSLAPSAGNWHGHVSGGGGGGGMLDYDLPVHAPQSYTHSTAHYSHTAHSR